MKVALVVFLCLAAASAREHVMDRYMYPAGAVRFQNVLKAVEYSRIVGGEEAKPHSRPFQVGLLLKLATGQQAFCGGSLISPTVVMTAAHCKTDGINVVSEFEVVLGAHNIYDLENTIRIKTSTAIVHENWTPLLLQNDIALIILPVRVELNDKIQTVKMPRKSDADTLFVDFPGTASGWGKITDSSTTIADVLHVMTRPVMTKFWCNVRYLGVIQDTHICTTGKDGTSICSGDSGGPLTTIHNGELIQIGIVSFGIAFGCESGWPGVYTRVSKYLDWISENANIKIE